MIKISHVVTALLFAGHCVAHAEPTNQPVSQGVASVEKNLQKNPDNKGLQNASERLKENEAKIAKKRAEAKNKSNKARQKTDKHAPQKGSGHDQLDRPSNQVTRPGK